MPEKAASDLQHDSLSAFPEGINSGIAPFALSRGQCAFAENTTYRGGFASHRPPFIKQQLNFLGGDAIRIAFETGIWQGAGYFKSEYGEEGHICSIGGRIFFCVVTLTGFDIREITPVGDPNSNGNPIAWMWQSERWMIINDGQSLPIFFDGQISRRSYGEPLVVGTTAVDWVAPAIGANITITLAANYTGPYNTAVTIDGTYYQVNAAVGGGYNVTLRNLSEAPGPTIPNGTQLLFPNNLLGQLASTQNGHIQNGLLHCMFVAGVWTCTSDGNPGFDFVRYDFPTIAPLGIPVDGRILSIRRTGVTYFRGRYEAVTGHPGIQWVVTGDLGGFPPNIPQYGPIYDGTASFTTPLGLVTTADFVTPSVGNSVVVNVGVPYNGPLGQKVVINGGLWEIEAANNTPAPSNQVNVTNINDTAGQAHGPATPTTPGILSTVRELPVGRMGDYGQGRNWMSLADKRSFIASDLVGGSSGTPALNSRDAVLHVTENAFLAGGGVFVVPSNASEITAMKFLSNLDASLGQGPLVIGTATEMFSCQAPVDRSNWQALDNPLLPFSLKGRGPLGQNGMLPVNSDTLFRYTDGIISYILARRDYTTWGNVPISDEVTRVLSQDNTSLLGNCTAVEFDNRVLYSALPTTSSQGVYHQGMVVMNLDPISSLRGKAPSIYDGFWSGINVFQFTSGKIQKVDRAFAFSYDTVLGTIGIYELLPSKSTVFQDNGTVPIQWYFETPFFYRPSLQALADSIWRKIEDGEITVDELRGVVNFQIFYRPDFDSCWHPWLAWTVCGDNMVDGTPPQWRPRMGFSEPPAGCDEVTNTPFRVGRFFQLRVQITGHCSVKEIKMATSKHSVPKYAPVICDTLCT